MKRVLKRLARGCCLFGCLPVVLLVVTFELVFLVPLKLEERGLAQDVAALRAQGIPTQWADLVRPALPPEQNAATYFLKAAEQTRSTELPSPDFVYSQLERGLRWEDKLDTVALAKGRKLLASRKQVLALIEQGARCPASVYPVDWQAGTGAQFPHLHRTRSLSRFLGLYSLVRAMDGKPDEAFDALQLDLAVQRSLCQEPGCISLLTATSSLEKELGNLELVLRVTTPSKRKTVALYEALGRFDLLAEQAEALDDEYTLVVWRYEALRSGEYPLSPTHGLSSFWTPDPPAWICLQSPPGHTTCLLEWLATRDERELLGWLRVRQQALRQWAADPTDCPLPLRSSELWPWYAYVSAPWRISLDWQLERIIKIQTRLNAARCGLAVVAFQQKTGEDPTSLDEVEKTLGWKLPLDPGSGKTFALTRDKGRLTVTSSLKVPTYLHKPAKPVKPAKPKAPVGPLPVFMQVAPGQPSVQQPGGQRPKLAPYESTRVTLPITFSVPGV